MMHRSLRFITVYVITGIYLLSGQTNMPDWSVDPTQFEFSGTVTASVYIDDMPAVSEGDSLGAFVEDQLRGVSAAMITPEADFIFLLLVYSNLEEGEQVDFRYYSQSMDEVLVIEENIVFADDMEFGAPDAPLILHALVEDCNGDIGGSAFIDECGYCVEGNTGLLPGFSDVGCGCDIPAPEVYCDDTDGDLMGNAGTETEYCLPDLPGGWVLNCSDPEPDCFSNDTDCSGTCGGSAIVDECGNCCGGNTGTECSYFNDGLDYGGAFDCSGVCFGDLEPDCLGICDGNSVCFPVLDILPAEIIVSNIYLGSSGEGSAQISNTGTADLEIYSLDVQPPFDQIIELSVPQSTLAPAESMTLTILITPENVGEFESQISIISNGGDSNITLNFNVISPGFESDTETIDFGDVLVGFALENTIGITSTGLTPLEISGVEFSMPQHFSVDLPIEGLSLDPGETANLNVTFSPQTTGAISDSMTLISNSGPILISLFGNGVTPELAVTPGQLNFSPVIIFESAMMNLTVSNIGNYSLTVLDILLSDTDDQFSIESGMTVIPPDSSEIISVWFNPVMTGFHEAIITVQSTGGQQNVTVSGTGITLPPVVQNPVQDITINEDSPQIQTGNFQQIFYDDYGPLSFSVDNGSPELVSIVVVGNDMFLEPVENANGTAIIALSAYDEANSVTDTMEVIVLPVPDPVQAFDSEVTGELNSGISITLSSADPDDDILEYTILNGPESGLLEGSGPEFMYTPFENFFGSDEFQFRVFDGIYADTALVLITVNPAEFQVEFQVDMNVIQELDLFLPESGMQIFLHVFDGFFPGIFPLTDENNDGIWHAQVIQGIPDNFNYAFAIDPDGYGNPVDFVYELNGGNGARNLETLGLPDLFVLDVVNFDDIQQTPEFNGTAAASATGLFTVDDNSPQMFGSGTDQTAVSVGFDTIDRNTLVSVQRINGMLDGEYPPDILVPGTNSFWWINTIPSQSEFSAMISIHYNYITGINNPADIRILQTESPGSNIQMVETSWQSWDETIFTTNVNNFSFWATGSVSEENTLDSQIPGPASSPTPLNDDISIDRNPRLSWQPGENSLWYNVYLWQSGDIVPDIPIVQDLDDIYYQVGNTLEPGAEYAWKIESSNLYGSVESETWQFTVESLPDLQVTDIQVSEMVAGQSFAVTWTITNEGQAATNAPIWNDWIWISPDLDVRIGESEDLNLGIIPNISYLEPGQSYTNTAQFELSLDRIGVYYLFVITDEQDAANIDLETMTSVSHSSSISNLVAETIDNNNFGFIEIDILSPPTPDLQVTDLVVQNTGFSNEDINLSWTVSNNNEFPTVIENWWDAAFITADSETSGDLLLIDTEEHNGVLLPGESYTVATVMTLPHPLWGDEIIYIQTDYYDQVFEYVYESNNLSEGEPITVFLQPPPDLTATSLVYPNETSILYPEMFSYAVHNQGAGAAETDPWMDCIYFSYNDLLSSSSDVLIGQILHSGGLEPDSSYTWQGELTIPDNIGGNGYIIVQTDCQANVFEHFFEGNNTLVGEEGIVIHTPDLQVTSIDHPVASDVGETITISWSVRNNDDTDMLENEWEDCLYLAPLGNDNNDAEILLSVIPHNSPLSGNAGYDRSVEAQIPLDIGGMYELYAFTDCQNDIYEAESETNNTLFSSVPIEIHTPDLIITDSVLPDSINSGEMITVSYTVQNTGVTPLINRPLSDYLVISSFSQWDSDSTIVAFSGGQKYRTLLPGESYTDSINISIPDGLSGEYFLHIITDWFNDVYEFAGELNNIQTNEIDVHLTPWPDLVITDIFMPDSVSAGSVFNITWRVQNNGTADLPESAWKNKIYFSANGIFNDLTTSGLGQFLSSASLSVGESVDITHSVAISPYLLPGDYYIFAIVDADQEIYEYTGEFNNITRSDSLPVIAFPEADVTVTEFSIPPIAQSGIMINAGVQFENTGNAATLTHQNQNGWFDMVFLSSDAVLDSSDINIFSTFKTIMMPGENYSTNYEITLPDGYIGDLYLILSLDNNNEIQNDYHKDNNLSVQPISIEASPTPDLIISDFSTFDEATSGQPVTLTWVVNNTGETELISSLSDGVFISGNTTIGQGDIQLGSFTHTSPIPVGGSSEATATVIIPNYYSGTYYLIIKTDSGNSVYEHNGENNNTVSFPVTVNYSLPADIIVTDISVPDAALPGESVLVEWTIQNIGEYPAVGYLRDGIYFSVDEDWQLDDPMLGFVDRNISLYPEETLRISQTVDIAHSWREDNNGNLVEDLPGMAPGDYHIIVRTDLRNNIFEIYNNNNSTSSTSVINVDLPELPLNEEIATELFRENVLYYKVDADEGNDLRIILDSNSDEAGNELYIAYDYVPTLINFDYSASDPFLPDQEILIPSTVSGPYYIMIYSRYLGGVSDSQTTTILAESLPFSFFDMSPDMGGSGGKVTTTITGAGFREYTLAYLRLSPDSLLIADEINFINTMELQVRWDLTDVPFGLYNVVLQNEGDRSILEVPGGMTVEESQGFRIDYYSNAPEFIRTGRVGSFDFFFTNPSNIDIPFTTFVLTFEDAVDVLDIDCSGEFLTTGNTFNDPDCTGQDCGDVFTFTDSTGYTYKMIQKTAVNIPPGHTADCRVQLRSSSLSVINVMVSGEIMDAGNYLGNINWAIETIRQELIGMQGTPEFSEVPQEVTDLINDPEAFANLGMEALIGGGFIDPNDFGGLPGYPPGNGGDNGGNGEGGGSGGGDGGGGPGGGGDGSGDSGGSPGAGAPFNPDLPPSNPGDPGGGGPGGGPGGGGDGNGPGNGGGAPSCGPNQQSYYNACVWLSTKICVYLGGKVLGNPCPALCAPLAPTIVGYIGCYVACKLAMDKLTNATVGVICRKLAESACSKLINPCDPNEIIGPPGYGEAKWVAKSDRLNYMINFENDPEIATAPAQNVIIELELDEDIDPGSFRLGNFGFGDWIFPIPENTAYYTNRIDLTDSLNLLLDVNAGIDVNANRAFWIFESIDPLTGESPQDPFTGFLAVNDSLLHNGEGFAEYSVMPSDNIPTGNVIEAEASIIFDINDEIFTPMVFNTVDAVPPVSMMNSEAVYISETSVSVSWDGYDDPTGSGLAYYQLYSAVDNGGFVLLADDLTETSIELEFEPGHYYRLFTRAIDYAGNAEEIKDFGEVFITVGEVTLVPVIISEPVIEAFEDSIYHYQVEAVYPDSSVTDNILYRMVSSPGWLTIDSLSGMISGTPGFPEIGQHGISVQAYDDYSESEVQNYVLTVSHLNTPPEIQAEPLDQILINSDYFMTLQGSDPDSSVYGDSLYFSAAVLPDWLALETDEPENISGGMEGLLEIEPGTPIIPIPVRPEPDELNLLSPLSFKSGQQSVSRESIYVNPESKIIPDTADVQLRRVRTQAAAWLTGTPVESNHGLNEVIILLHDNVGGLDTLEFNILVYTPEESGCTDPDAANYNPEAIVDDGSCDYHLTFSRELFAGANLVSYYSLPADPNVDSVIAGCEDHVLAVIGESVIAVPHPEIPDEWIGGLNQIDPTKSYWILADADCSIEFEGIPVNDQQLYSLHTGANMVSYPFDVPNDFLNAIPADVIDAMLGIIGEGVVAIPHPTIEDHWIGGLSELTGGDGYWFLMMEDMDFTYNLPPLSRVREVTDYPELPDEISYLNSPEQAFYFVESLESINFILDTNTWLVAKNDDIVVGAAKWGGEYSNIPVMGNDEYLNLSDYCNPGTIPQFYLWDENTDEWYNLHGNIDPWQENGVFLLDQLSIVELLPETFSLHQAYPNPFNPVTKLKFDIPVESDVRIQVFNILGRQVTELLNYRFRAGYHHVTWNAENISSGVYFVVMTANPIDPLSQTPAIFKQKVMLLK